jgi:imidazolonepropionase-like amidohydrolase
VWNLAFCSIEEAFRPGITDCLRRDLAGTLKCCVFTFRSVALLLAVAASLASCSREHSSSVAITHVTVIDATGAPPKPDRTVIVEKSRISAVGSFASTSIPGGVKVIDGAGKFMIPGLADMHIHLTGAGEPGGSREFIIPLLVANGITTVRDMGGTVDLLKQLRAEINDGKRDGPQIFFTGPYLDGNPPSFEPSIVVQNAAEATHAVQQLKREGVDFIKVQSRLLPDPYYAIAREAKKQEIRFLGHVPDSITAAAASDAGQASIEHLTGVLLDCSTREQELRQRQLQPTPLRQEQALARERSWNRDLLDSYSPQLAENLARKFQANQTWQVPTFPILVRLGYITPATDLGTDSRLKYIPRKLREIWEEGRKQQLHHRNTQDFEQRTEAVRRLLEIVDKMNAAGVPIMAGTDAAAPSVFPGSSLHDDLAYLVQAGLTPMQALQAATSKPVEFLHRASDEGTIEKGKRADLVLLDANPLDDIHNTQTINAVVLNGKLFERADLDALLEQVQQFAASH